jgi:hypothetical protein
MPRFRSGRSRTGSALLIFVLLGALGAGAMAAEKKELKRKKRQLEEKSAQVGKQGLQNIPLPIGHQAKGLVIPDFDLQGRLRDRFEAGIARRIDDDNVQLRDLKMTTYTPDKKTDLLIDMTDSVLNLKTRVISSQQRTTVRRSDFQITGDTMRFDAAARQGTLIGNVKMVIEGKSPIMPKETE